MRLAASEHVRDRLAFVRGERGHIDKRLHLLAARRPDDPAGISVAGEHNRSLHPLERPVERRDVVLEDVSGKGAATALTPLAARAMITFVQLDPSAQAPWTSTTVASFIAIICCS